MMSITINRHLTAIGRVVPSRPVQALYEHNLIDTGTTVLDYGCGRGDDVRMLNAFGAKARGWDPYFAPDTKPVRADVVVLAFVINVIENKTERADTLRRAWGYARRALAVGVRTDETCADGSPYLDGYLTPLGRFNKFFTQREVVSYVQDLIGSDASVTSAGRGVVLALRRTNRSRSML